MTSIFIRTVGSSATSANRRHSRLPLQAAPGAARGIVTSSRSTPSKPPSTPSRPRFASASGGKADGEPALFPIADQGSGRVGSLRGFLPRALSNACPHASPCTHGLRTRAGIEQRLTTAGGQEIDERGLWRRPSRKALSGAAEVLLHHRRVLCDVVGCCGLNTHPKCLLR